MVNATFVRIDGEWLIRLPAGTPRPTEPTSVQVTTRKGSKSVWIDPSTWMADDRRNPGADPDTLPILAGFVDAPVWDDGHRAFRYAPGKSLKASTEPPSAQALYLRLRNLGEDGRQDIFDGAFRIDAIFFPSVQELQEAGPELRAEIAAEMAW